MHGTHGTKCYVLLRGFARILRPVEGDNEMVGFRPDGDVRPGDVSGIYTSCIIKCFRVGIRSSFFPDELVVPPFDFISRLESSFVSIENREGIESIKRPRACHYSPDHIH